MRLSASGWKSSPGLPGLPPFDAQGKDDVHDSLVAKDGGNQRPVADFLPDPFAGDFGHQGCLDQLLDRGDLCRRQVTAGQDQLQPRAEQ